MKKLIFLMTLSLLAFGFAASAQNIPEKKSPVGIPANTGIENIMTARQLVAYGYDNNDALSLLMAAKIYLDWNPQPLVTASKKTKSGKEVKEMLDPFDIKTLIADAVKFSKGDPAIKKIADELTAYTPKHDKQATFTGIFQLEGLNALVLQLNFKKDKSATVIAEGDGKADIDLYVLDQYNNVLAKDEDEYYKCSVNFYPKKDDNYYVMIVNRSTNTTNFAIATN